MKTIATLILSLWLTLSLAFAVIKLAPGDPIESLLPEDATKEMRDDLRDRLGLNEPLLSQYADYLVSAPSLDFGQSFRRSGKEGHVRTILFNALPPTIHLALASLSIAWLVGIGLGLISGTSQSHTVDRSLSLLASIGLAVPTIWLGPILILLFCVTWNLLPMPAENDSPFAIVLPSLTLGTALATSVFRQVRASTIQTNKKTFIAAARARGFGKMRILFRHTLPNTLLPVSSVAAAQLAALLGGTVIVETIFARPGLGSTFLEAFYARDYPLVQACFTTATLFYVLTNSALVLIQQKIDPRIGR